MKRSISVLIISMFVLSASAGFSMTPEEAKKARYEEIKKVKDEQRKLRETEKTNPPAPKKPGFWDREAERSGFAQNGKSAGNFFKNMNPVPFFKEQRQRYEERKAAAGK